MSKAPPQLVVRPAARWRRLALEPLEDRRLLAAAFAEFIDPHPSAGNGFGTEIVPLSSGNVVITAPNDDAGGPDAGAVYLYNGATGALISTLRGAATGDEIGGGHVWPLSSGNFVIVSPLWHNAAGQSVGAATFVNGTTGLSGTVIAANSLFGSMSGDSIGSGGVVALPGGKYVVISPNWSNGSAAAAGAVTFASGATGISGLVSAANSLVGTAADDQVGESGVTALPGGNYVVISPSWNNGAVIQAGAVTFANGATGIVGPVSALNSLVGGDDNDLVGNYGVTVLASGNYVVASPDWNAGVIDQVGAVTFGSGTTGVRGLVSAANSLIGSTANDFVGLYPITALTNGNYVVVSPDWTNGAIAQAGAVTLGSGTVGISGAVSAANSLVGSSANDSVGSGGVTALTSGNYVVDSPEWANGQVASAGAVTFASGTTGIHGPVTAANSLVGTTEFDSVGSNGVTALATGNYVVASSFWQDPVTHANWGAATFASGVTGISGPVAATNSLVGSGLNDGVAAGGVTALTNGNYVVVSPLWQYARSSHASGAVTLGNGLAGTTGVVSPANSLVGNSIADDFVGGGGITPLPGGNYLVQSPSWNNGAASGAGAVTFASGTTGLSGTVSAANSLLGSIAGDAVGGEPITVLANGDYVVVSPAWDNGVITDAGAVTLGSGAGGIHGLLSAANSLVGSSAGDKLGTWTSDLNQSLSIAPFSNGNFVVVSGSWDNGTIADAGAVTFATPATGLAGTISSNGAMSRTGQTAHSNLQSVVLDNVNQTFLAPFLAAGRVLVGSQVDGFRSPWHNPAIAEDVNDDGLVVAGDALRVINYINAGHIAPVPPGALVGQPYGYLDANNDNNVSPSDALQIINSINARLAPRASGEGEPESTDSSNGLNALIALLATDTAGQPGRKKVN